MSDEQRDAASNSAAGDLEEGVTALAKIGKYLQGTGSAEMRQYVARICGDMRDAAAALRTLTAENEKLVEENRDLQKDRDHWEGAHRRRCHDWDRVMTRAEAAEARIAELEEERDDALRDAASLSLDLGIDLPELRLNHGFQVKKLEARIVKLERGRGAVAQAIVALLESSKACPQCDLIPRSDGAVVPSEHAKGCFLADAIADAAPDICTPCHGTGLVAEYEGLEMRPVEASCYACDGTGTTAARPPRSEAEAGVKA